MKGGIKLFFSEQLRGFCRYGSPTMVDLEKFTSLYAKHLADAGEPDISVQVSLQFERY